MAADRTLVNAEVARQGFATAVVVGGNDRFYPPVAKASDEAAAAGRGLYSADIACTLPGRVEAVTSAVAQIPTAAEQDPATGYTALSTAADNSAAAVGLATSLEAAFANDRIGHVWSTFDRDEQDGMAAVVRSAREDVQREKTALTSAAESTRIREEADVEAARAAEEERQAREARERQAEADARQRATVPAPPAAAAPTPAPMPLS